MRPLLCDIESKVAEMGGKVVSSAYFSGRYNALTKFQLLKKLEKKP